MFGYIFGYRHPRIDIRSTDTHSTDTHSQRRHSMHRLSLQRRHSRQPTLQIDTRSTDTHSTDTRNGAQEGRKKRGADPCLHFYGGDIFEFRCLGSRSLSTELCSHDLSSRGWILESLTYWAEGWDICILFGCFGLQSPSTKLCSHDLSAREGGVCEGLGFPVDPAGPRDRWRSRGEGRRRRV